MTRTAAALARDRQLATDRQRAYRERKARVAPPAPLPVLAPLPEPATRDRACSDCGRAHQPSPVCPDPPRDYHDAPFLKKYGG